jgi:hypothetical protein
MRTVKLVGFANRKVGYMPTDVTGKREALLSIRTEYAPDRLERLPSLGDRVRLLLGGNSMLVIDVNPLLREEAERLGASGGSLPFGCPIGVLYIDNDGHISQCVVPLGSLCKA